VIRLAPLLAFLVAGPAAAGEIDCWFEGGVVVVPAEVAGIAGAFVLDTGAARTALHDTVAKAAGLSDETVTGAVRFAGEVWSGRAVAIADLDVRTWNLPTPVAGVIGADILQGRVLDVTFAPCRVRLWRPRQAPPFMGKPMTMTLTDGRPTVDGELSDGVTALAGRFVVATGANAPLRLADDIASAPSDQPQELYPDGVWLSRLPQLRFANGVGEGVATGLMKPEGALAGVIGGEVLANFRLRFDFPARRLTVAPAP
jgi:hypothetical protein